MQYIKSCLYCLLVLMCTLAAPASVYASTDYANQALVEETAGLMADGTSSENDHVLGVTNDRSSTAAQGAQAPQTPPVEMSWSVQDDVEQAGLGVLLRTTEEARSSPIITEVQTQGVCPEKMCTGNAVEFVELYNPYSNEINLTGLKLRYHGTTATQYDAADLSGVVMAPYEFVIVGRNIVHATTKVIALQRELSNSAGALFIADSAAPTVALEKVAWGSASVGYYDIKAAEAPSVDKSIQRCFNGPSIYRPTILDTSKEFLHYKNDIVTPGFGMACSLPVAPVDAVDVCSEIILNEIGANRDDQFIEIYNSSERAVDMTGCQVQTNRSSTKVFAFGEGVILAPYAYKVIYIHETELTLTKTTTGTVYLVSSDGKVEIDARTYTNLASGTSWSRFDDGWKQTYAVTPNEVNMEQLYLSCDEGYVRNETTGRCNKITPTEALVECGEGKYRSEESGRCRNVPLASMLAACKLGQYRSEETNRCRNLIVGSTLTPCKENQYRSEETNRCRNFTTASTSLRPCKENQYRSEETNRCRNLPATTVPAVAYAVEPIKDTIKAFVGWWVLGGLILLAVGYAGWEWRSEIRTLARELLLIGRRR